MIFFSLFQNLMLTKKSAVWSTVNIDHRPDCSFLTRLQPALFIMPIYWASFPQHRCLYQLGLSNLLALDGILLLCLLVVSHIIQANGVVNFLQAYFKVFNVIFMSCPKRSMLMHVKGWVPTILWDKLKSIYILLRYWGVPFPDPHFPHVQYSLG